ncbi:hypothetical protein Ancab_007956 [Ancistrocladus abbreviatus]
MTNIFAKIVNHGRQPSIPGCYVYQLIQKLKKVKLGLKDLNRRHYHDWSQRARRVWEELVLIQNQLAAKALNKELIQTETFLKGITYSHSKMKKASGGRKSKN